MLTVHDLERAQPEFVGAIKSGLSRLPKSIPCRFLYDAWGSRLFEAICRQPEYYLTRTESRSDDCGWWTAVSCRKSQAICPAQSAAGKRGRLLHEV
jgi:hypothetical protein